MQKFKKSLKILSIFACLTLTATLLSGAAYNDYYRGPRELKPGMAAPSIMLKEIGQKNETEINFKADAGAANAIPTLVLFWYLECPTCVEDVRHIKRISENHNGKISIITVNVDSEERRPAVSNFIKNNKMESYRNFFEQIIENGMDRYFITADKYGVMATPSLFLISKNGIVEYKAEREIDFDEVEKRIKEMTSGAGMNN